MGLITLYSRTKNGKHFLYPESVIKELPDTEEAGVFKSELKVQYIHTVPEWLGEHHLKVETSILEKDADKVRFRNGLRWPYAVAETAIMDWTLSTIDADWRPTEDAIVKMPSRISEIILGEVTADIAKTTSEVDEDFLKAFDSKQVDSKAAD